MKSRIASAIVLTISLLACAQETAGTHPAGAGDAAAMPARTAPMRIVLEFKNPSAIDAPAFVQRLQALTQAPVHYVAAVSQATHVYRLQVQPGQSPAQLLQQLGAMPEIARAEFDRKIRTP